jgi:hypothetical protein
LIVIDFPRRAMPESLTQLIFGFNVAGLRSVQQLIQVLSGFRLQVGATR